MPAKITFILCLMIANSAFGKQHNKIDTLGASKAGLYVALEEYGYNADKHSYFVTVKIINTYTQEYVGNKVEVEEPAHDPANLTSARVKAKQMASEDLKRFKISG